MYAPYGAGILIGPKGFFDAVGPYQIGGGNLSYITPDWRIKKLDHVQVHDPGTPNAAGVIAIAAAMNELDKIGMDNVAEYEHGLMKLACDGLSGIGSVVLYPHDMSGSILPFDIRDIPHKLVARVLTSEYGISVRSGSFCAYRLVNRLKGIPPEQEIDLEHQIDNGFTSAIPGMVRASVSLFNRVEDIRRLVGAVGDVAEKGLGHFTGRYRMDYKTGEWYLMAR
ncbi:aminotransferase class V-fold PLP-dependent enzyme [Candidatus Woesearchaeota archaeon]|nr:aminotransferase class V-fold PLP-dependent enzyme [Candidatus Woesearchaeota archaeon]